MGALIARPGRRLKIHIDGARLANAVAAGFDPKALAVLARTSLWWWAGPRPARRPTRPLSLIDRSLGRRLGARLKHAGQLVSKSRFLAAPWIAMLEDGAWVRRAAHANAMAKASGAGCPFSRVVTWRG